MSKWRIITIIFIFSPLYLSLIFQLYNLQVNKNSFYKAKAESQQLASGILTSSRGSIFFTDKNNNLVPAAMNKEFPFIYAVPKEIQDQVKKGDLSVSEYAEKLSPVVNISTDELAKKFSKQNDLYELLIAKASDNDATKVSELNLKGIYVVDKISRSYPFGSVASQVLGFVAPINNTEAKDFSTEKGRYGIESFFENDLAGTNADIKGDKVTASSDGKDITLTIDRNIQAQAEEILKKLVTDKGAVGGSVIVQDPKTGKILTMASFPDFDPNNYSKFEIKNLLNPTVQAVYEPGSVFKILTMAAGIDSGKITPDTIYVDKGYDIINGRKVMNWDHKAHGKLSMTNVIEQSINTGTIFAEQQTGHSIFKDYMYKFGLADLTGVKLPGELKGNLSQLTNGKDINYATASYGQGVAVTPMEMINAASAIANGGVLMRPLITNIEKPEVIRRVISEDTSKKVTQMMVSAVKKNVLADIPNYNVAGKTGTAYIPDFKNGGYTDQVVNTFIGWAPAFEPKFIILIKLDKPKDAPLAGTTVVPAFRQLAEFILNYYNVAPDNL